MAKKVNIRWLAHAELSAAHAAYVVATRTACTDQKTEQMLVEPVTDINNRLLASSIDVSVFWRQYLNQLLRNDDLGTACAIALMSSGCSELQVEQTAKAISGRLSDARNAFRRRFPKLTEQLELRAKPLRDKWDTFGPGLLRDVGRQIWDDGLPDDWWTSRVTAVMIQPMRGGDGGYDVDSDRFWVEAMLTDVDPTVPEVLRVAWLMTRMAIDKYTRQISGDQSLAVPWSLVSVPLVLTAAANLEMIDRDDLPIQRAMALWRFSDARSAEQLVQWWQQYTQTPTPLPVALKVLHQTLEEASAESSDERLPPFSDL